MSIIKLAFDQMLKKIPPKKSNEQIYQEINWTFSIVCYIESIMVRLELRDEKVKRYVDSDLICSSKELDRASFKKKFQLLVQELLVTKQGLVIEDYIKYYMPSGQIRKLYFYKHNNKKIHTMTASIKKVKQIPDGAICL